MPVYLVQHGKALSKKDDPERGLSEEGFEEIRRIAGVAATYRINVSKIIHSGKKRAQQTAEIYAEYLKPKNGCSNQNGLNPLDDVVEFSQNIDNQANTMIVGHLPFMDKITSYLVTGSSKKSIFKFQNGGIVCLDLVPDKNDWIIKWTLMPNIN